MVWLGKELCAPFIPNRSGVLCVLKLFPLPKGKGSCRCGRGSGGRSSFWLIPALLLPGCALCSLPGRCWLPLALPAEPELQAWLTSDRGGCNVVLYSLPGRCSSRAQALLPLLSLPGTRLGPESTISFLSALLGGLSVTGGLSELLLLRSFLPAGDHLKSLLLVQPMG